MSWCRCITAASVPSEEATSSGRGHHSRAESANFSWQQVLWRELKYSAKCLHCSGATSSASVPSGQEGLMRLSTVGAAGESFCSAPRLDVQEGSGSSKQTFAALSFFFTLPTASFSRYDWVPERASATAGADDKRPDFTPGPVSLERCSPAK